MTTQVIEERLRQIPLKEITTKIGSGATPTGGKNSYKDTGISLIRSLNVYDFSFKYRDLAFIDDTQADGLSNVVVAPQDILLNITGASVARCCMVQERVLPARVNQHVAIVRIDKAKADPCYVLYCINSPHYKDHLLAIAQGGATREALTKEKIENFEIPLQPLPTQHKISSILSAYDDLIENNLRRIKILEEMAQNLYREWFVKFRFPGYQKIRFIDSKLGKIPKGWEVQCLDELCSAVLDGDWIETKDQGGEDFRLLQISNIGLSDFVETGKFRYVTQETFDRLRCTEIRPDDLLIARMPSPIGRGWLAHKMPWRIITAVDVAIARPDNRRISPVFLLHFWNQPSTLAVIEKQSSGTTRLRITRRALCAMPIPTPPLDIQEQFSARARPMLDLGNVIRDKNTTLRRTRDLLLPKLISGELDVSELDIKIPEETI